MLKTFISTDSEKRKLVVNEQGSLYSINTNESTLAFHLSSKFSEKPLLRYPGGKTRAVSIILKLIPNTVRTICAPFLGGGSVEIACASRGIKIKAYDIFLPLVEFWQYLLEDPTKLANEVKKFYPLPKEKFYHLQAIQFSIKNGLTRAAVFYVLNRCSYSGSTLSGGMSPGHPRFTMSSIQRLREFYNPNIKVEAMDFKESISQNEESFLYLDPPYLIKNKLYGRNGDTHKDFDHIGLRRILQNRNQWILSYNNCPEIIQMYGDYKILFPVWKYGMSNNKDSREILVLSKDVQEFHNL